MSDNDSRRESAMLTKGGLRSLMTPIVGPIYRDAYKKFFGWSDARLDEEITKALHALRREDEGMSK